MDPSVSSQLAINSYINPSTLTVLGTSILMTGFVIIFAFVYYLMISSFLLDVALRRLVKASFDESWRDFSDLIISYFLGMFVYLYIIYFTGTYIVDSLIPSANPTMNITFIVPFGLGLLYSGRIVTRRAGVFYGKLHFSAIFLSAAVALGMEFTYILKDGPFFSPELITSQIIPHVQNYIILLSNQYLIWSFIGVIILSTFGEMFLSRRTPCEKSLLVIADKFPSDFRVITGMLKSEAEGKKGDEILAEICNPKMNAPIANKVNINSTDNQIRRMLSEKDLVSVRCVTKSLVLVEYLKESNINKGASDNKVCCRTLKSPLPNIIKDRIEKEVNIYTFRFLIHHITSRGDFKSERNKLETDTKKRYFKNIYDLWIPLIRSKRMLGKSYYFGDLRFVLTENRQGDKKIMFLMKDMGRESRIGCYLYILYSYAT